MTNLSRPYATLAMLCSVLASLCACAAETESQLDVKNQDATGVTCDLSAYSPLGDSPVGKLGTLANIKCIGIDSTTTLELLAITPDQEAICESPDPEVTCEPDLVGPEKQDNNHPRNRSNSANSKAVHGFELVIKTNEKNSYQEARFPNIAQDSPLCVKEQNGISIQHNNRISCKVQMDSLSEFDNFKLSNRIDPSRFICVKRRSNEINSDDPCGKYTPSSQE